MMKSVERVSLALVCVSIVVISLMSAGVSHAAIDIKTCVGLWLFDEGKDDEAKDSSGSGNDGTLMNGPKWVNGKFGKALSFDGGDDIVEVKDADNLDLVDAITVSMLLEVPDDATRAFALSKNDNANGFRFEVKPNLYWVLEKGDAQKAIKSNAPREEWAHIVGTFDGKMSILYIDGEQVGASLPAAGGLANSAKSLIIGAHRHSGDLPYNGLIDEVAIFNVALEEEDIQDITEKGLEAALGLAAVEPGGKLAASWAAIKAQ